MESAGLGKRRRNRSPVLAGLLGAVLLLVGAGCARQPPEAALRAAVDGLSTAIQERDASAVQRALAQDFIGPGGMDRDDARRLAALRMLRHDAVGLTLGPLQIELQGERATVTTTAALTGGQGGLLPESAGAYRVVTGWRLADGEWKMTSAEWTPLLGQSRGQ